MFQNIQNHFQNLLETDLTQKPRPTRFGIRCLQIFYASLRDLTDGHLSLQAMSLVYTTLITLVPLLAISFSVLKGFGVHNEIEPMLENFLSGLGPEKATEITEKIIGFVDNVKVGVLGAVGFALLIYAVIALMQKIEKAFNYIWRVAADRTFAQRFSDYLSVLLMGPLLIFLSAGITTTVQTMPVLDHIGDFDILTFIYDIASVFFPWIIMAVGFTFFYTYMPNTKVRIGAAFSGGLVAAMLWKAMGYVFSAFIAGSANYVAIYAAFATLIVFMVWLYASWLVILVGANISFYVQYPRYLRVSRAPLVLTPHIRLTLGLSVMRLITRAHYNREEGHTLESLSKTLNAPILAIQKVLGHLEDGKIIVSSKKEPVQYIPATPLDKTPLEDVFRALETQGGQGWVQIGAKSFQKETDQLVQNILENRQELVTSKSIAEVLL